MKIIKIYEIGDRVKVLPYPKGKIKAKDYYGSSELALYVGKVTEVKDVFDNGEGLKLAIDKERWSWNPEWVELVVAQEKED